jgi:catechol-2,3-dioxygenase
METIIADLVNRFEAGGLTRRQLIQGLATLMAACTSPAPNAAQAGGLRATGIDHVSVLVNDLQQSATFYQSVFGMTAPVREDKPRTSRIRSFGWA